MECIFMVAVIGLVMIVGDSMPKVARLINTWISNNHATRMEELRIRRLEALGKMDEPSRKRLIDTMPDWLDPEDDEDIEAWAKSRSETLRTGKASKRRQKKE